jgi:plastocyanin
VTWTNRQPAIQHTVTADDGSFGSDPLSTGSSFSHVFATAGTYSYHCSIHPAMIGTVVVAG